jgi:glyoxylase-like metal-dependent hydrolase (beta-lactamase superfamily II)
MGLEDHAGDIVQKARQHASLRPEAVAAAAGLSLAELEQFEREGKAARPVNYAALCRLLRLDQAKFERIVGGWEPASVDLSRWSELRLIQSTQAGMAVNCYLVWDAVTREAALFDTGFAAEPIISLVEANRLEMQCLFITHRHFDHAAALEPLRQRFTEASLICGSPSSLRERRLPPGEIIRLGGLKVTCRKTPGHTEDGATYLVEDWPGKAPGVAFVGDALFAGSMGRAIGRAAEALQHIRDQILSLPPETLVCPGHGPLTTVGEELSHNPFWPGP